MKLSTLLSLTCAAALGGCNTGKDMTTSSSSGDGDNGGDVSGGSEKGEEGGDEGGSWVVGEDGAMIRLNHDGEASTYPLDVTEDLRAIACKGADQAVAVGEAGLVVVTFDGGAAWDRVDDGEGHELRAVALSAGPTGYIVGDGVILRSLDDSRTWERLDVAAHDWTSVSTTAAGRTAWLTAGDEIWRLEDAALERMYTASGPLAAVAVTPDGDHAVAVGEAGLLIRSDDGGAQWTPELVDTTRDLHAVRIAGDASLVLAVGEAGVVVRAGEDDIAVAELLDPALSLRAIHLSRTHAHAVGDHGVMMATHDQGLNWDPIDLGLEVDLLGLDDLHGEPHL
jgi:photosystem II stability/assembly factor-like uncharacterized protein